MQFLDLSLRSSRQQSIQTSRNSRESAQFVSGNRLLEDFFFGLSQAGNASSYVEFRSLLLLIAHGPLFKRHDQDFCAVTCNTSESLPWLACGVYRQAGIKADGCRLLAELREFANKPQAGRFLAKRVTGR